MFYQAWKSSNKRINFVFIVECIFYNFTTCIACICSEGKKAYLFFSLRKKVSKLSTTDQPAGRRRHSCRRAPAVSGDYGAKHKGCCVLLTASIFSPISSFDKEKTGKSSSTTSSVFWGQQPLSASEKETFRLFFLKKKKFCCCSLLQACYVPSFQKNRIQK